MGFQLFICFVDYYELHCMRSLRRHVAVLNRKVSYDNLLQRAELARQIAVCKRTLIYTYMQHAVGARHPCIVHGIAGPFFYFLPEGPLVAFSATSPTVRSKRWTKFTLKISTNKFPSTFNSIERDV